MHLLKIILISSFLITPFQVTIAAEVDQFSFRNSPIKDSLPALNKWMNDSLRIAVENTTHKGCSEKVLYSELMEYFENHTKGKVIDFIKESGKIDTLNFTRKESIYRKWSIFDGFFLGKPGSDDSPLALAPIMRLGKYRVGTDKLEHLFDRGFAYFKQIKNGTPVDRVLLNGVKWEFNLYGGRAWGTGMFSYGDLAANFDGIRFWNRVLAKEKDLLGEAITPYVVCDEENRRWVVNLSSPIDMLDFVDDSWDEAINCSTINTAKTKKKFDLEMDKIGKSCPLNQNKLALMYKKYGFYSDFVLNNKGNIVAKRHPQWVKDLDMETGIAKIPQVYRPYLNYPFGSLYYNRDKKYMRTLINKGIGPLVPTMSLKKLDISSEAPKEIKRCWYVLMSGGRCGRKINPPLPTAYTQNGSLDLLAYVRDTSYFNGLVVAKEVLEKELAKIDSSKGELKKRVINTTIDKDLVYEDSFAMIEPSERSKIGVYFALGIGGDKSDNAKLVRLAAEQVSELGFTAEMLELDPNLGTQYNASLLLKLMKRRYEKVEKVIFISASKGTSDFLDYFLNHGEKISEESRNKVKLLVSLSGVVRGSMVADYLSKSSGATSLSIRTLLRVSGKGSLLKGVNSIANDVWEGHNPSKLKSLLPNLKWISFPSIPEHDSAVTKMSLWSGFLKKPVHKWSSDVSPSDGLVESAASILPPDTGIEEHIISIYGPHAMALGSYEKGIKIAPLSQVSTEEVNPDSGPEILDAVFRALPQSLIED